MLTIIKLSNDIKDLKNQIENYIDISNIIDINNCTDYRIASNIELLIYNNRTILYSCCYSEYKNKMYITHIYNRSAELIYKYDIDYNK